GKCEWEWAQSSDLGSHRQREASQATNGCDPMEKPGRPSRQPDPSLDAGKIITALDFLTCIELRMWMWMKLGIFGAYLTFLIIKKSSVLHAILEKQAAETGGHLFHKRPNLTRLASP
ncbi:hypothetical protein PanWU01x14_011630, partial [Parasponia andersonii]